MLSSQVMTLILNNDDVKSVLTMKTTMKALEEAYRQMARREAVCWLRSRETPAGWEWFSRVLRVLVRSKRRAEVEFGHPDPSKAGLK